MHIREVLEKADEERDIADVSEYVKHFLDHGKILWQGLSRSLWKYEGYCTFQNPYEWGINIGTGKF